MSMRKSTISLAIAAVAMSVSATFAADVAQPETPGSEAPKAVAEAQHLRKQHGIDYRAKQPEAQAPGDKGAQARAESIHMKKSHGVINDSADKRLEMDHPNH